MTYTINNIMQKVEQFYSKNQFIIRGENKVIFQSYNSTIAILEKVNNGEVLTLGIDWDYSTTTSKYLYKFIDEETYILDKDGYSINSQVRNATNKRKYIQSLIIDGTIKYDKELV